MDHTPDSSDHGAHDILLVEATGITHDSSEVPGTLVLVPRNASERSRTTVGGYTEEFAKGYDLIFGNKDIKK